MLGNLVTHRDLLSLLVVREVRIRYARAALGLAWALFIPLVMMLVFSALNFGRLIPGDSSWQGLPYPVFAYCGLVFWTHFATSLTQGTNSLVVASDLLKKCAFPREVIPLAKTLAAVLDLAVGLLFLAILVAWNGLPVGPSLVALPLVFLLQLAFTAGTVLILSAANVFYRDVNYLVQVGIVLLMFATNVVYPITPSGPVARVVLGLNPMSAYLRAYREILLLGKWPGPGLWVGVAGAAVALLAGGLLFRRLAPRFAEEL